MSATLTIAATFENGVFVPKRPIRTIPEHQEVTLNIQVTHAEGLYPLPDEFFPAEGISAPFDLPFYGESRMVEVVSGGAREIDPAAAEELFEMQCTQE